MSSHDGVFHDLLRVYATELLGTADDTADRRAASRPTGLGIVPAERVS